MRIAFVYDAVYPYTTGGAERRNFELAKRLARTHDVHLYCLRWWTGASVRREHGLTYHGVFPASSLWHQRYRRLLEPLVFAVALWPRLWRAQVDVIDCASIPYLPVLSCWLVSRLRRIPLIVTWHEFWGREVWQKTFGGLTGWFGYWAEQLALRCSPQIVAVSSFTERKLRQAGRSSAVTVVTNGVEFAAIARSPRIDHGHQVLVVGRLIREKRIDLILAALRKIPADRRPRCLIIGEGQERSRLSRLVEELGLASFVEFRNFISTEMLVGLMKGATVLVSASEREGFGLSVLEAQACATPTIVLRHPENAAADLVQEGHNGFVVTPNADELARRLEQITTDQTLAEQLGAGARQSVRAFDWDILSQQLDQYYRSLIAPR